MKPPIVKLACAALLFAAFLVPVLAAEAAVGDTDLISRASEADGGAAANGDAGPKVALSNHGGVIAFESSADNLSAQDNDAVQNIYVRGVPNKGTILVSRANGPDGAPADGDSSNPAISPAGRFVAFESNADNLSSEDNDAVTNIFVRDTWTNRTILVSRATGASGPAADADSHNPSISGSATGVSFESDATNLSAEDNDGTRDVFVRDVETDTTTLVSRASGTSGAAGDANSYDSSVSQSGRRVAFVSDADNLSTDDNDSVSNVFVYDILTKFTTLASRANGRLGVGGDANSADPWLSMDGRCVSFTSYAENLGGPDPPTPSLSDVFVRDIQAGTTSLASSTSGTSGVRADGNSFGSSVDTPVASDGSTPACDQRSVAFLSAADNLVSDDAATFDVFVRDMPQSATVLASRASGVPGAAASGSSFGSSISGDGQFVGFVSEADNLSSEDNDAYKNVYRRALGTPPPPPPPPPDLGSNIHDHASGAAGHADHTATGDHSVHSVDHSGHTPSGASGGLLLKGGTLFAAGVQDVDKLVILAFTHERGTIIVDALINMRGRASKVVRFRRVKRTSPPHVPNRIRLRLTRSALRSVKRALRHGRRLRVRVTVRTIGAETGSKTRASTRIRLRP